jgi:hypothetical protein
MVCRIRIVYVWDGCISHIHITDAAWIIGSIHHQRSMWYYTALQTFPTYYMLITYYITHRTGVSQESSTRTRQVALPHCHSLSRQASTGQTNTKQQT